MRSKRFSVFGLTPASGGPLAAVAALLLLVGCSLAKRDSAEMVNEGDAVRGSNLEEAISKYEQAVNTDPTNRIALWKLALAYHKKEAWSKDAVTCAKA